MTIKHHRGCNCKDDPRVQQLNADRLVKGLKPVKANIPQGMKLTTRLNVMRGRDILVHLMPKLGCKPRGNRQPKPWNLDRLPISEPLVAVLEKSDKGVVDWLTKAPENRLSFFSNPVASLVEAGVELTRAEQKELSAQVANNRAEFVLTPNTTLNDVSITASPTGKIGSFRPKGKPTSCKQKITDKYSTNTKEKKGE